MIMVPARKQPSWLLRPKRKFVASLALWLSIAAMAGCDSASNGPPIARGGDLRTEQLKTDLSPEEMRDLAQPISNTPGLSVERNAAQVGGIGNEGYSTQMGAARGLNSKRLFDSKARNDDERFERLEAAMQALQDDFDRVNPSINRLVAIESEIQTLVDQLQMLVGPAGAPAPDVPVPPVSAAMLEDPSEFPPVQEAPIDTPPVELRPETLQPAPLPAPTAPAAAPVAVPAPVSVPTSAPALAPTSAPAAVVAPSPSGVSLVAVRVADHDKTTRVVFEVSGSAAYTADVDAEQMLLVNFASGNSALSSAPASNSNLVKSIDITPQSSGGFIVAMSLSKMTKIAKQGVLNPDAQNRNYRIYIDLVR